MDGGAGSQAGPQYLPDRGNSWLHTTIFTTLPGRGPRPPGVLLMKVLGTAVAPAAVSPSRSLSASASVLGRQTLMEGD